ncbi:12191_t:CDS:2, partial [Funneliformis geosporum]
SSKSTNTKSAGNKSSIFVIRAKCCWLSGQPKTNSSVFSLGSWCLFPPIGLPGAASKAL